MINEVLCGLMLCNVEACEKEEERRQFRGWAIITNKSYSWSQKEISF